MSGFVMGLTYRAVMPPNQRYVLTSLADHCDDDGNHVFPAVEHMCWKLDLSERHIQRMLRMLEQRGYLIPVAYANGGRGHATEYRIAIENFVYKPLQQRQPRPGDLVPVTRGDDLQTSEGMNAVMSWARSRPGIGYLEKRKIAPDTYRYSEILVAYRDWQDEQNARQEKHA